MAYSSLLSTKFFVPPVRATLISRPRLLERLAHGLDGPLTLVSAPAGYGKTTLFAEWRAGPGASTTLAWLSLDVEDNDPPRFFQYLLACLDAILPGAVHDLLPLLQSPEPPPYEAILPPLANALAENKQDFVLVLDDYHVIETSAIHAALTFLLSHLPPCMHLAILSRTDPPLPLARLRARNNIIEIREADLRFTPEEASVFLNEGMGLSLSAEDLAALESRTEGWIAGLQLAALSMQSCKDIHAFILAFTGSHHYVMDYLVEEVLKLQSEKVSTFLLQTSILDRLCASLCEAVVAADTAGTVDGQGTLETLEGMNLFLIPLDNERRWYRYHHLFADVLRKRLEQHYPGSLPRLHQRASVWFEQNGLVPEAIRHSLTAGDQDRVIQLIEQHGPLLLISGELNALSNWIKAVESRSQTHPWIYIIKAWLFILTGQPERAEEGLQIAEKLISPLETDTRINIMRGAIATGRSYRAHMNGDTNQTATFARQAIEYLPDIDIVSRSIRSIATTLLGEACLMNGELEEARQASMEAKEIGLAAGDVHVVMVVNCALGRIFMELGLLHQAADIYTETLQMATRPDGRKSVTAGEVYAELSQVSYEWNNLEAALEQVQSCIALCRQWGYQAFQATGSMVLARLEQVRGNAVAAAEHMIIAEKLTKEHHFAFKYTVRVKCALVRLWIAQGNLEKAAQIVQESAITIHDEIPYLREPEFLALLHLLLAQGNYDAAMLLSKRLLQNAEAGKRSRRVIEVLVLQALIFQGRKETEQALAVLKRALSLARPERYMRTFVDEGEPMARLLHLARSRQVETEYATELLSVLDKAASKTQPPSQLLIKPLTLREIEVLRLIKAGCSNQDIADQLFISIPTVKRHISNIYAKLGVESRTQAVAIGKELKIFD